jgi:hypothetical protein
MGVVRTGIVLLSAATVASTHAFAQTPRLGGEFQVNTFTTGVQDGPAAACDADGNFVIAWQGRNPANDHDFFNRSIFFRQFDASGMSLGAQTEIDPEGPCAPPRQFPEICRDASGNGVLVFRRGSDFDVRGSRFDSTRASLGSEFEVSTGTSYGFFGIGRLGHDVACEDNGDFVVAWTAGRVVGPFGAMGDILSRRFTSTGTPIGTDFLVNSFTSSTFRPSIASDDDGDFIVAWVQISLATTQSEIYARRFDSAGMPAGS